MCLAGVLLWIATLGAAVAEGGIEHDRARKLITMADGEDSLLLRLSYDGRCMLDRVAVRGTDVLCSTTGVCSAIRVGSAEYTTRSGIRSPMRKVPRLARAPGTPSRERTSKR